MKTITLASKSVDRKELLQSMNLSFEVLVTNVDEESYKSRISDPIELVKQIAKAKVLKAKEILTEKKKDTIIIAADTIVEFNGEIIGKGKNENEAFQILTKLEGNTHHLITGFAIAETNRPILIVDYDSTAVKFFNLSNDEIWGYIKTGEWKGRAGAYSIKERAGLFVDFIKGSLNNVIGLPTHKIYQILKKDFNLNWLVF